MSDPKTVRPITGNEPKTKSVGHTESVAEPAVQVSKPPIPYEKRIKAMSNKQLHDEVKRVLRSPKRDGCDEHDIIFGTVLDIMLDSQAHGLSHYLR